MLSQLARLLLALTALSPVAFTWAIASYGAGGFKWDQVQIIFCASMLAVICALVIAAASRRLNRISFSVQEVKAVDNEVVAYIVTYLFPLIAPAQTVNSLGLLFVMLILAAVLSTAHAFTFNPLLTIFGYHFYEVKCSTGVTYLLMSKGNITDVKKVAQVGRISHYLMLDLT